MGFETTFSKDVWHREAQTLSIRNGIRTRRWGMRVTVYDDPVAANNGDWVLEYNQANTNRQSNLNWLKVADIGQTWGGGGGGITTADNGLTVNPAGNVQLGGTLLQNTTISTDASVLIINGTDGVTVNTTSTIGAGGIEISNQDIGTGVQTTIYADPEQITLSHSDGGQWQLGDAGILIQTNLDYTAEVDGIISLSTNGGAIELVDNGLNGLITFDASSGTGGIEAYTASGGFLVSSFSGEIDLTSTDSNNIQTTIEFDPAGMLSMFSTADGFNAMSTLSMNGSGHWMGQASSPAGNATLTLNPSGSVATLHGTDGLNISQITVDPTTIELNGADDVDIIAFDNLNLTASGGATPDINLYADSAIDIFANTDLTITAGADFFITSTGALDFSAASFTLNGLAPSNPSTEFFRGDGTWAVPGGGGSVTADNGITLTGSNLQWGGALIQDTFIPSDGTPRSVTFGRAPSNNPLSSFTVLATGATTFYVGSTIVGTPNIQLASNGSFVNSQYSASTNDTGTNIQERSIRSTGVPVAGFGGREAVGVEITAGLGGAIVHEYVVLDPSGAGEFQWNICMGTVSNPIPNTQVVQSFIMRDRNVGFFTKDTSYGSGEAVIKIANATTPANALVADSILMWAEDTSDNLSSLAFFTEQAEEVIGATVPTHKLKIQLNGTEYYLLLSTI